jgi:hypothetical protein
MANNLARRAFDPTQGTALDEDGRLESAARARAVRDARVDMVVELMAKGCWHGARSIRQFSAEWGIGMGPVGDIAREARGIIRRCIEGSVDELRAELVTNFDNLRTTALSLTRFERVGSADWEERAAPALQTALGALQERGKVLGLYPSQKVEIVTTEAWQALSAEEKRERLERAKARIAILEAELSAVPKEPV